MYLSIRGSYLFGLTCLLLVLLVACDELFREDDPDPTVVDLRIITYRDHAFTITWFANRDSDFASYTLYESPSEDMSGVQEVYQTSQWDDTTWTISGVTPKEDRYYQVEVTNVDGNSSSSQVELATTALRIAFVSKAIRLQEHLSHRHLRPESTAYSANT